MRRRDRVGLRAAVLGALIGAPGCWSDVAIRPSSVGGECALDGGDAENERWPGYPYDYAVFKQDVAPLLVADCAGGGCHADASPPSGGLGDFTVFAGAPADDCATVKTFKQFRAKVDLTTPDSSRMIFALEGGELANNVRHPLNYAGATGGQAKLDTIAAFIAQASETCVAGGGCSADVRDFFDYDVYQRDIQPGIDAAGDGVGCSVSAACHEGPDGQRGFALPASPAPDSEAMAAAYQSVKSRISLDADPRATLFYVKATEPHSPGGLSTTVDEETAVALVKWIDAAIEARAKADDLGCADPAKFDLAVFRDDIMPVLTGEVDLNPGGDFGISTGCTRGPCHGQQRPGSFTLIETDPPEVQLANFACFVNLTSPLSSQVLACPRDDSSCAKSPHPGEHLLTSADDLNYQRLLSFLFSATSDVTPVDFTFFARRINPQLDIRDGDSQQTCADQGACHGIAVPGQVPANGANLGIIPNAGSELNKLKANFTEASAFINFLSPSQSSLYLYPTDEIANLDHPVATGFHHPSGNDVATDSQFARDLLTFAHGLRPDSDGYQRSWLVGGDFVAGAVGDDTVLDDDAAEPILFGTTGGDRLNGEWDALFADGADVDVASYLGGDVDDGRIAYAAAYFFNVTAGDLDVDVELSSVNDARIRVGDAEAQLPAGGNVRLPVTLPSTRATGSPTGTLVLLKLFERPEDGGMSFRVRLFRGGTEQTFDDDLTEVIIKLGPRGGL